MIRSHESIAGSACEPSSGLPSEARRFAQLLDQEASRLEWDRPPTCPICKTGIVRSWKRLLLEAATWTREDAFRPRGFGGTIMVTQRFKDACERHDITNAIFTTAEESGHDFYFYALRE